MSFSNPINVATASMEHIYERLCWLYATFRSTFVYDAIGQPYPLSDITQLSRAKIPYPELFNEMIDYKQNEVVQELQMKDVLCKRNAVDLYDQRDSKGQMSFSSFNQLPTKLPVNSVALSNEVWNIGDRIFVPILVQQHALTAIQQLQWYAIVFRNVLASNQHAVVKERTS